MKINPMVAKAIVSSIRERLNNAKTRTDKILSLMESEEDCPTVEKFMELKKELLFLPVRTLPIMAADCYFCVLDRPILTKCSKCLYKLSHGKCSEKNSDYSAMVAARLRLLTRIDSYYSGETYEE